MSSFPPHSRDQLRQAYAEAWRRHGEGLPLTPLDALLVEVIGLHPEYQPLLRTTEDALAFEPATAPAGTLAPVENPFLHLGLHMAVREQLAIDRPPGVRALAERARARLRDAHAAEHALMEALAETLWEAQRSGQSPDEAQYLLRARTRLGVSS